MFGDNKNLIIVSCITLSLLGTLIVLLLVDIPYVNSYSIKTILSKHDEIIEKEAELVNEKGAYENLNKTLETTKASYNKEKSKYEAISDETINIIKDANTEENYSIEYMWIKLGNYARKHNLSLVMVEPGNNAGGENTQTADQSVVANNNTKNTTTSQAGVLKIQITGSYIDLSDFVFEVENDDELKFKLDNIAMECVSGTTIKTTFDVKNMLINK